MSGNENKQQDDQPDYELVYGLTPEEVEDLERQHPDLGLKRRLGAAAMRLIEQQAELDELQNRLENRRHRDDEADRAILQLELIQERLNAAEKDPVTGLPTRAAFTEELRRMKERFDGTAVILDMRGLKGANDTWGHKAGDALLAGVGEIITGLVREGDLTCRWGGDEFVILARVPSEEGARVLTERLAAHFSGSQGAAECQVTDTERVYLQARMASRMVSSAGAEEILAAIDEADQQMTREAAQEPTRGLVPNKIEKKPAAD